MLSYLEQTTGIDQVIQLAASRPTTDHTADTSDSWLQSTGAPHLPQVATKTCHHVWQAAEPLCWGQAPCQQHLKRLKGRP
jgi:hypothetical protein